MMSVTIAQSLATAAQLLKKKKETMAVMHLICNLQAPAIFSSE
jgi:hypothetical protein